MAKCVRPAPEADRPARRLLQVQNRLKPGAIVELVAAYQNGTSLRDLEIRFQIARTTVMAHLRRAGVPKRRPVLTGRVDRPAQLHGQGWSLARLKLGTTSMSRSGLLHQRSAR